MAQKLTVIRRPDPEPFESEQRRQICQVGRWMYRRGYIVAHEGNLSVRLDDTRILVTPAGACKGLLTPKDLLLTDLEGSVIAGTGRPSSELAMHLLFYRLRPDVRAVCHAHPPTATGFAAASRPLQEALLPEVILDLGMVPLAAYGMPGTSELCAAIEPLVPAHDAILLENHGVVTCGPNLAAAYHRMETVEHFAQVLWTAETLGGPHLLPRAEVQKLLAAKSPPGHARPLVRPNAPQPAEASGDRVTISRKELESLLTVALQNTRTH